MSSYITLAELRDTYDVPISMVTDAQANFLIPFCSNKMDSLTGQWFESKALTLKLDGTDNGTLFLPVFAISVTSVYLNSSSSALAATVYTVYNRFFPDDRKNPKIRVTESTNPSIFERRLSDYTIFEKGTLNQTIVGSFGYVESDGSTPEDIKRAVAVLVVEYALNPPDDASSFGEAFAVTREVTDGHSLTYAFKDTLKLPFLGTGIPEVDRIIAQYKAPLAMAIVS